MKATHKGLGVRFGGRCAVCGRHTGDRDYERAATSLYRREDGRFVVVHPACAGGRTKTRVGGGCAYRTQPNATIEVATDAQKEEPHH
jgi:hypothetical protein